MASTAHTVYISEGPYLEGAAKVVRKKDEEEIHSNQTTSTAMPGTGNNMLNQSQLEQATLGSLPVVNTLNTIRNSDGTFSIHTFVADGSPVTGPGISGNGSLANTKTSESGSVGIQTGWIPIGSGYKYYQEDGSGYKTGWHFEYNEEGGKIWYYFDESPDDRECMVTGWKKIMRSDGVESWYHFRADGRMSRYWEELDGMWYYLEPQDDAGYMVTGWKEINGYRYYFIPEEDAGYMMLSWHEIDGRWYYFHNIDAQKGIMAANHMVSHTDGKQYYLGSDGAMVINKQITDPATGMVYDADENGVCTEVNKVLIGDKDTIGSAAEFKRKYGTLVSELANQLGVDVNLLGAVILVESSGSGFNDGNLLIRFENHHFVKYTGTSYTALFYYNASEKWKDHKFRTKATDSWRTVHTGKQSSEYDAFSYAKSLNENAAYKSISMGLGQIMGFNYATCGYSSAKEMFEDFNGGHQQQIIGMVEFIKNNNNGKTLQALQSDNISSFVTQYNGSGNVSDYTSKINTKKGEYQNA